MTVKEMLFTLDDNVEIIVKQYPIGRIDSSCNLVERQRGNRNELIDSHLNYLDYEVKSSVVDENIVQIICKANPKQENEVITALYSARIWR